MFSQIELDRLIDAMRANQVVALSVEHNDQTLHLTLEGAAPRRASIQDSAILRVAPQQARSASIGHFIPRGTDDGLAALGPAAMITQGETLGYVAQRNIRTLVTAPVDGILASAVPDEGTVFGHGDVVFELEVSR